MRFFEELKRRRVLRVAGVYAVVAWGAIEVAETTAPLMELPGWVPKLVLLLSVLGFPVAVALAWSLQVIPDGVMQAGDLETRESNTVSRGYALWLAMAVAVVVVAFVTFRFTGGPAAPDPGISAGPITSLAVLPFVSISSDQDNQYFADGVHEDILAHLSQLDDVTILARTAVMRYRHSDQSVREIAAELGADAILEGSVRRDGSDIRIVTQLINPLTGGQIWADTYDRRLESVFEVQTEIAQRVVSALETTLSPEAEDRILRQPTGDLDAHDVYLRGREAFDRSSNLGNEEAIRLFRRALTLDPEYVRAWAGLGDAFARRVTRFGYPRTWADSAAAAARTAIRLDPGTPQGHNALGRALQAQGRIQDALAEYLVAVEHDRNHYEAVSNIGGIYQRLGRYDEAVQWFERALRLAPNNPNHRLTLALNYIFLGMDDTGRDWLDGALVLMPSSVEARLVEVQLALYEGEVSHALALAEAIVRDSPDEPFAWTGAAGVAYMGRSYDRAVEYARESLRLAPANDLFYWHFTDTLLGLALVEAGDREGGEAALTSAIRANRSRIDEGALRPPRWELAAAYAALGNRAEALAWLRRAYEVGFRHPRWVAIEPAFDGLRDDGEFRNLIADLEREVAGMRGRVADEEEVSGRP